MELNDKDNIESNGYAKLSSNIENIKLQSEDILKHHLNNKSKKLNETFI